MFCSTAAFWGRHLDQVADAVIEAPLSPGKPHRMVTSATLAVREPPVGWHASADSTPWKLLRWGVDCTARYGHSLSPQERRCSSMFW
jgi:hypothetical protein